jgi:hypothetical protein
MCSARATAIATSNVADVRETVAPDGRAPDEPDTRGIASNHGDVDTLCATGGEPRRAI